MKPYNYKVLFHVLVLVVLGGTQDDNKKPTNLDMFKHFMIRIMVIKIFVAILILIYMKSRRVIEEKGQRREDSGSPSSHHEYENELLFRR